MTVTIVPFDEADYVRENGSLYSILSGAQAEKLKPKPQTTPTNKTGSTKSARRRRAPKKPGPDQK